MDFPPGATIRSVARGRDKYSSAAHEAEQDARIATLEGQTFANSVIEGLPSLVDVRLDGSTVGYDPVAVPSRTDPSYTFQGENVPGSTPNGDGFVQIPTGSEDELRPLYWSVYPRYTDGSPLSVLNGETGTEYEGYVGDLALNLQFRLQVPANTPYRDDIKIRMIVVQQPGAAEATGLSGETFMTAYDLFQEPPTKRDSGSRIWGDEDHYQNRHIMSPLRPSHRPGAEMMNAGETTSTSQPGIPYQPGDTLGTFGDGTHVNPHPTLFQRTILMDKLFDLKSPQMHPLVGAAAATPPTGQPFAFPGGVNGEIYSYKILVPIKQHWYKESAVTIDRTLPEPLVEETYSLAVARPVRIYFYANQSRIRNRDTASYNSTNNSSSSPGASTTHPVLLWVRAHGVQTQRIQVWSASSLDRDHDKHMGRWESSLYGPNSRLIQQGGAHSDILRGPTERRPPYAELMANDPFNPGGRYDKDPAGWLRQMAGIARIPSYVNWWDAGMMNGRNMA